MATYKPVAQARGGCLYCGQEADKEGTPDANYLRAG